MSERTTQSRRGSRIRATAMLGVGTLLAGGGIAGLAPGGATASSHREAPAISGQPQYDNTDLYAWVDPNSPGKVSLVANWIPFEEPGGGPNFYPWATDARYDVNIDNDDDAKPDVIYRWKFRNSRTPKPSDSFTGNGTFLTNNGPVDVPQGPQPALPPDLRPAADHRPQGPGQGPHRPRQRAGRPVARR